MGGFKAFAVLFALSAHPSFAPLAQAAPRKAFAATAILTKPARLLTEASALGEPIARLEPGLQVAVESYSTQEDWVQVRTPGGREGWIPVRFTNLAGRRADDVLLPASGAGVAEESAVSKARKPASSERALAQSSDDLSQLPSVSTEGTAADGPSDMTEVEDISASEKVSDQAADSDARRKFEPAAAKVSAAAEVEASEAQDAQAAPRSRPERQMRVQQMKSSASASAQARAMSKAFPQSKKGTLPPSPAKPATIWPWEVMIGLDYMQQMDPETMHGFGLRAMGLYALDETWSVGGGLDYMYASVSETDEAVDVRAKATRTVHRVAPYGAGRFRKGDLQVIASLGLDFQKSAISTTDIDTGAEVAPGPSGLVINGSEWTTGIGFRLSPAYLFSVGDTMKLGPALSYALRYEFGGDMFHAFGVGALLSMGF